MNQQKPITVLSLYDNISASYIALKTANIAINKFYSSESDKTALKIQQHHYATDPKFVALGEVRTIHVEELENIDLVISNIHFIESITEKPFTELIRILKQLKQKQPDTNIHFFVEASNRLRLKTRNEMMKQLSDIFDNVNMTKIDGSLVTASHRRRIYFTNIANISQPEQINVAYKDVLINGFIDEREKANVVLDTQVSLTGGIERHLSMKIGNVIYKDEAFSKLSADEKREQYPFILKASGYKGKGSIDPYDFPNGCYRIPSVLELERLISLPDGYVSTVKGVAKTGKMKVIGLTCSPSIICHIINCIEF